jgi:hypothetical protein
MDRLVDLDAVFVELSRRRPEWARQGLGVGEFTWRDAVATWPQPIVSDRALVTDPESLGMSISAHDAEARLVLWTGGWADLEVAVEGQFVAETPQFVDVESCLVIADSLVERLLGSMESG